MFIIRKIVWIYLIIINIYGFAMMFYDKKKSENGAERTPESRIFKTAVAGAAAGIWAAMYTFRHKTMKPAFKFGIPALLVLNLIEFYIIFKFL